MQKADFLACPFCKNPITLPSRRCPHCQHDLIAAMNAAEAAINDVPALDAPTSLEALVPLLGEYLVEAEVISDEQLAYALRVQQDRNMAGEKILIGQVLVNLGFIDREGLDRFLAAQIFEFKRALEESNKQLEERVAMRTRELEATLEKLSELNHLKANLVATVSHELLAPIQVILGHSDLMAAGSLGSLSPRQLRSLQAIRSATHELQELISELLQFGSASAGQLPLMLRPISLNTTVKAAVEQLRPRASDRQIELRTRIADNLPPVRADGEKISWVVGQFVDNAIKFTAPGGQIEVSTIVDESEIVIAVSDSGIGIPEERQQEVFVPLHQLDNSLTRRYGGIGLGLSLAQCIVEAHGSEIELDSRVAQGSRFAFRLRTVSA